MPESMRLYVCNWYNKACLDVVDWLNAVIEGLPKYVLVDLSILGSQGQDANSV